TKCVSCHLNSSCLIGGCAHHVITTTKVIFFVALTRQAVTALTCFLDFLRGSPFLGGQGSQSDTFTPLKMVDKIESGGCDHAVTATPCLTL
ncbi:MAG: hypothetical protein ACRC1U_02280, partial [Vibrionaceae bacterium]